jgi:hypothetical protein
MKSNLSNTLSSLTALLQPNTLVNLHTIHVIDCNSSGPLTKALAGVKLPNVRTVIVPDTAHGVLQSCPNATEVRCVGGNGLKVISSLKYCKCEVFEGCAAWFSHTMKCGFP